MGDRQLLDETERAVARERGITVELLELLGEVDTRRLYLGEGCSSLFTYCTQVLHLSEHAAYHRIEAARAARRFPRILDLVRDGSITLTTVAMLRPHLTDDNHEALLAAARHKTKREIEHQIACLAPKPDAASMIRRVTASNGSESAGRLPLAGHLPVHGPAPAWIDSPRPGPATSSAAGRGTVQPLAEDRYLLRVTLSADAHAKLRRAQDLMRHAIPTGDPALIIDKALTLLVDQLERTKIAKSTQPRRRGERVSNGERSADRPSTGRATRRIPAAVRREVWSRDQGRCAFVGPRGRCTETGRLEFHHVRPFALGGPATVDNIALRCQAHNNHEADRVFGARAG